MDGRDSNRAEQPQQAGRPVKKLGEILVENAALPADRLVEALARQQALAKRQRSYPLGQILVGLGYLDPADVSTALDAQRRAGVAEEHGDEDLVTRITSDAVRIQEDERRRISTQLHDDVAQILGNLVLMMDACMALAPEDAGQLRRYLGNARDTAKAGFRRVQRFALDLRPPMLDDLGLAPTIAWYAERFTADTDIDVAVHLPDALPILTGEQETALFRIVQEALHNVRKHAGAKHVVIDITPHNGSLRLSVADDGVGISQSALQRRQADGTHLGMAAMRYRVALLRGHFSVEPLAASGTMIVVEIPVGEP